MEQEQIFPSSADDYFKKLAEFTQQQQQKVSSLIADNQKVMNESKPFVQAAQIESQIEALIQRVNNDLDSAMENVNERMKLSTQPPAELD